MRNFISRRITLAATFVLIVVSVLIATFVIVAGTIFVLQYFDIISVFGSYERATRGNPFFSIFILFILCTLMGTTLTTFFSKKALLPIRNVIEATGKVAEGDFDVQIDLKGVDELEELSRSFNKMTKDLKSIETLRSDFINNFSHEFKTPIVSIRGFAKLLKESELSEAEKQEYLDIIIVESKRLADLATNVLNLSKYDTIEIVRNKTEFRLDEQIRRTVILMASKWSAKEITIDLQLEEVNYVGSDDLTQQIWINLLDNAIKFSDLGGTILVKLTSTNGIQFEIQDNGAGMDNRTLDSLFERFYQGDASHSKSGNGLGLALVKRIVDLCEGEICVDSEIGVGSKFTVRL